VLVAHHGQVQEQLTLAVLLVDHDVKTGRGGIREIEVFAQVLELTYGTVGSLPRAARFDDEAAPR
jgi:glutamine synthetase adenylyltransferase